MLMTMTMNDQLQSNDNQKNRFQTNPTCTETIKREVHTADSAAPFPVGLGLVLCFILVGDPPPPPFPCPLPLLLLSEGVAELVVEFGGGEESNCG